MADMRGTKRWISDIFRRTDARTQNQLGTIPYPLDRSIKYRDPMLDMLDAVYEGRQYDHLVDWNKAQNERGYIPVRSRKPRIRYAFAKVLCQRITSKLIGQSVFPTIKIEEYPDTAMYFQTVQKAAKIQTALLEPTRRMLASGSVLVRFYLAGGALKIEHYLAKYCYPEFDESGDLETVDIRYCYPHPSEKDENGNPKKYWFQMTLGKMADVLYKPVEFKDSEDQLEPEKIPEQTIEHNLGFVQAEWMRTAEVKNRPDGYSIIEDVIEFIAELDYSISQSSQAVGYNQDPQLVFSKMDEDEMSSLIRSATKAWNLGREGDAKFLESSLVGVDKANELRTIVKLGIQDIARVVFLDPEKMVSHAQSGEAMKVLHGPMVELIDELRPMMGDHIQRLTLKMGVAMLMMNQQGMEIPISLPDGYQPKSLNMELVWPPVFPQTTEDLQKKVQIANSVSAANLISRETMTRWLAKDFDVEDVEAEIQKIAAQPVLNPFGGF